MKRVCLAILVALVTGCATDGANDPPSVDTGTISGDSSEPRNRARIHTELAALYYSRANMGVALEELRKAVEAEPDYAPAYGMFGLVYMELRENRLAEDNFRRALSLAPNDPDLNHNYGWYLCQTGREKDSVAFFLKATRNPLYATPARSFGAAGACSIRANDLAQAEELLQRALRLQPTEPLSLLQMGQLRYKQGRYPDARDQLERFERVSRQSAESLWLGVRTERQLGDRIREARYASLLRRNFPRSTEYQSLQRGEYN